MEGDLSSSPCYELWVRELLYELLGNRYVNETVLETSDQLSQTGISPSDLN